MPYVIFALSAVFFWSISSRAMVYTLMPTIAADLGFSSSAAGFVIAAMLLGYTTGSWIAGWLPGTRKTRMVGGVAASVPAAALLSQTGDLVLSLVASLGLGLGLGIYIPLGLALIVDVGRGGRRAVYIAIHELAATLGSFSGSVVVALMLVWTDWRGSILTWCLVGVAAVAGLVPLKDPEGARRAGVERQSVPFDLRMLYSVAVFAVGTMIVMGLVSMLPLIMVRAWGMNQAEAASMVGSTRLAGLLGVALVAFAADRVGHPRLLVAFQALALAGTAAMSLGGTGPMTFAGILLLAVGASGDIALLPLVIAEAYPIRQRERALAVATGPGGILGMVVAPALFGVMLDLGAATGPIVFTMFAVVLSVVATLRLSVVEETDTPLSSGR